METDSFRKCIHLQDCFDYRNHICIVTELLGMSVFDFLKGNSFIPFPPNHVQHFAKQLLESVACISLLSLTLLTCIVLHSLNLVHTDLKPENILLVDNDFEEVRCNQVSPCLYIWLTLAQPKAQETSQEYGNTID